MIKEFLHYNAMSQAELARKYKFVLETDDKQEMQLLKDILEAGLCSVDKFNYPLHVIKKLHNKLDYALVLKEVPGHE